MDEKIDFCIEVLKKIYGEELSPETKKKALRLVVEILTEEVN